jgi:hypothetical protein
MSILITGVEGFPGRHLAEFTEKTYSPGDSLPGERPSAPPSKARLLAWQRAILPQRRSNSANSRSSPVFKSDTTQTIRPLSIQRIR